MSLLPVVGLHLVFSGKLLWLLWLLVFLFRLLLSVYLFFYNFFYFVSKQISTVDAFQGGEKDLIILSCVRTDHIGFIDCDR